MRGVVTELTDSVIERGWYDLYTDSEGLHFGYQMCHLPISGFKQDGVFFCPISSSALGRYTLYYVRVME